MSKTLRRENGKMKKKDNAFILGMMICDDGLDLDNFPSLGDLSCPLTM